MKRSLLFLAVLIVGSLELAAQKIIPLYDKAIPNSIPYNMKETTLYWEGKFGGYQSISYPTLEIYLPAKGKGNGAAVVICPGGGYGMSSYQKEGINIAKTFISHGVAAFILKYRLPSDSIMQDKSIGPLQDAQQAVKLVRQRAAEWGVDTHKIGIMGFSAGGHLASTAGTHFDSSFIPNPEKTSLRPDFMILVYAVISLTDSLAHMGSRENLLGDNPSPEKIKYFSSELQVTDNTPPTWITHTGDDRVVVVDNSIVFYKALLHHHVPAEMHLYPKGDHGFVLSIPTEKWMGSIFEWMKSNGWLLTKK
ncbi:alpha/beta hydrolase [Flavihumibacter profundi]|uniref:alpha/beta hydrolase n=1 Tax=Flavihumibacter profundi TaxID=2716883 RepID=UPI001CC64584|nr:alpha/beta hydrolase [Flavihumibacter profundi]MBZ5855618.1 alpha/beta hydrolase [Flavihumibacter profundi]